jgi:fatty acid/phospholipid biosynthesis enzyme
MKNREHSTMNNNLDLLDQRWYVYCILSHNSKVKMKISIYSMRHLENITRQALSPVTRIFRTCLKCSLSACGGGRRYITFRL